MTVDTASAIYEGRIRHRRHSPRPHAFDYRLFMMYLDLDELEGLLQPGWLASTRRPAVVRYRRRDYFGDQAVPLRQAVAELVQERTGRTVDGPVRMLTHLRYWGLSFNPVTFYYCFDADGERLEHIVAEITNTPWGERHCYVLSEPLAESRGRIHTYGLRKDFHVSPFMDMDMDYRWKFSVPDRRLLVHMENHKAEAKVFDATLSLSRTLPVTPGAILRSQARYPAMTAMVMFWIYHQAFKLWRKKTPFHSHPKHRAGLAVASKAPRGADS